MSAKSVAVSGTTVLEILVNYVFVYPIEPPGAPADWRRLVAHQYGNFAFANWPDPSSPLQPWDQTFILQAGSLCGSTNGYTHPNYPSEDRPTAGPTPSGQTVNPYSTATVDTGYACARTAGT